MTWMLAGDPGSERLMEYEAKLNDFFASHDALAICQYNSNRFPPQIILDVLRTHPLVIYGGLVSKNLYYLPPEEFLKRNQPRLEVKRLLTNICEREIAEQKIQQSYQKLRDNLFKTIGLIAHIAEMRDPYTAGHQKQVAHIAEAIAKEIGLSKETIEGIRIAGLMHDIGKITVPIEILSKPGKINEYEIGIIQKHCHAG